MEGKVWEADIDLKFVFETGRTLGLICPRLCQLYIHDILDLMEIIFIDPSSTA